MSESEAVAEEAMLAALHGFRRGRGRVRVARLVPIRSGVVYRYGATLVTAHRTDGATVVVAGDAWEVAP
ncbi:hypothetical protein [Spongiactinospora sp. TRM90649]|uniref:hypothetical protein n=1 Tax=Spongiactinospora sp. TRM90649 TaxID=3031114 RepID=UPI0023F76237|nr:hypothetical protein [Spongiactinospora sp. TRM90649]MDF5757755.1 hypothetical protein [Spongiactinospora sp. TRM90649]